MKASLQTLDSPAPLAKTPVAEKSLATVLSELFIAKLIHHLWPGKTNIPWYNIVLCVEFFVYALYYYCILGSTTLKRVVLGYLIALPACWFVLTFKVFELANWNSYIDIIGSLFTICLSVAFLFQLIGRPELVKLSRTPEFWIAVALILYYSGSLPFTGMLHFLTKEVRGLAKSFVTILQILNILLYSLICYAFLCKINRTSPGSKRNMSLKSSRPGSPYQ